MANPFDRDYGSVSGRGSSFNPAPAADVEFVRMRERVADSCREIRERTSELRRLLRDIGTRRDDYELRTQITELRKRTFAKVESTTDLFTQLIQDYGHTTDTGRTAAINSLRQTFTQTANEFGRVYEQIVNKLQQHPRPKSSADSVTGSGEVELPDDRVKLISQQAGQTESDFHTDYQLTTASYAERRAEDMVALEQDIEHLCGIMNDLSRLNAEQREGIDHIEAYDERAAAEVDRGNKQLGTVVRYKRCNWRLICAIVIVVLIIVAVVILAVIVGVCGFTDTCKSSSKQ